MIRSVESGNIRLLKSLVEKADYSLEQVDEEGNNLLHRAVMAGRKEIAKYISRRCEDLMVQWNIYGLAPVHLALLSNRPGLVEALLWFTKSRDDKYKDIKTRDNLSLLQYMVKNSHPSIIKLYLNDFGGGSKSIKSKINEYNQLGQTAMHLAAASGLRETLMLLYDHGGDLFKRDFDGMLPFHHALSNGFLFTATFITKLMDKNPEEYINDEFSGSTSCLLRACESSFDPATVKCIIKWGGNVNKKDMKGNDAIYYASNNKKISRELLKILNGIKDEGN